MTLPMLLALTLAAQVEGSGPAETPGPGTRAAELRKQRQDRARHLHPPERRPLEAVLYRIEDDLLIERVLNPPRGVYLRLGGIGEGAGFGAGPAYRHRTGAFEFSASAAGSLKRYVISEARLILPGAPDDDGPYVELYARRRDFPQEDFFGLGADSRESQRTSFALRDTLVRPAIGFRAGDLTAGVGAGYLSSSVSPGTDTSIPSIEEVFTAETTPGLSTDRTFSVIDPFEAPQATAPASLLRDAGYVSVEVRAEHPEHAAWRLPVRVYFRRTAGGWQTVGLLREVPEG